MKDDSRKWGLFFAIVGVESGIGIFLQVCPVKIVYFIIYTPLYHPTFFYFRLESVILDRSLRKQKALLFNVALQSVLRMCETNCFKMLFYNILLQKHLKWIVFISELVFG